MLMHCPIIAKVFHKINTFFKKITNIFTLFLLNGQVVVGGTPHTQYVVFPFFASGKKLCQEEFFCPEKTLWQNDAGEKAKNLR